MEDSKQSYTKFDSKSDSSPISTDNNRNEEQLCVNDNQNNIDNYEDYTLSTGFFPSKYEGVERSCLQRYLGKIEKGSLRGSIFSMVTVCMGSGCLTIPYSFSVMSIVITIGFLIFAGLNMLMNLYFLAIVSNKIKVYEYSGLLKKCASNFFAKVYDYSTLIYLFGALIAYQVIMYRIICTVNFDFFYNGEMSLDDYLNHGDMTKAVFKWSISFGIAFLILYPLCLLKNLSEFRAISLLGIFSIFYIIIVLVIEFPFYLSENNKDENIKYNIIDPSEGFKWETTLAFFPALSSIFFAYGTPVGALPVYQELTNNVQRRIKKVYRNSIILLFSIYILIGLSGYLSVPMGTPNIIIDRKKIFDNDIVMSIGKILFLLNLIFTFAVNYICLRISIVNLLFKDPETFNNNNKYNYAITFVIVLSATLIACVYSEASSYMSILGGFLAVIITNFLPTYLWVKTNDLPKYHWRNIVAVCLTGFIVCIGWFSGIITAIGMFRPKHE